MSSVKETTRFSFALGTARCHSLRLQDKSLFAELFYRKATAFFILLKQISNRRARDTWRSGKIDLNQGAPRFFGVKRNPFKRPAPNMNDYLIEPLSRKDILVAYPLIRATIPNLGLRDWKRLALANIGRRPNGAAGILIARSRARHHVCGMLSYRTISDLASGKTLEVSHLVALDIFSIRAIMLHLLMALGPLAKRQRCSKVRIIVSDSEAYSPDLSVALLEAQPEAMFEHALKVSFNA